jgi:hypothetical protein
VNHVVNFWILGEYLVQRSLIGNVHRIEGGTSASQFLNAADDFLARRIVAIVDNDDFVAGLDES